MRFLHRLTRPGCGPECRTTCDHQLAMSALRRLGRSEGGTGPSTPPPRAGASLRPAGAAVDAINTPRSAPAA